ncbi:MAG: cytochrome c biogenesis CcdA family protein [Rubrobacteraceae bacterium]|nr:cytochrome c biogenesis protein CcdA [Rubrobacteraceae bacterium]MCL6437060.1 cytochrome c biogenesis CcdA family protein [Rubrobacteraceae bacterium]
MVQASLAAAFFGGLLSLLSPCSALLLPAFFAYAFRERRRLLGMTVVFYAGLLVTLVPLGMGLAAASRLFYGHRQALIVAAGALMIAFGVMQVAGRGFALGSAVRLQQKIPVGSALSTFALGTVYGFGGFCSGPILGAVLTIAASSANAPYGALLLAVYAAGMAAPLFALALLWEKMDLGHRRWLRGKDVSLGRFRLHSTSLISGAMFSLLGVLFIATGGTGSLPAPAGEGLSLTLQNALQRHAGAATASLIAGLSLIALLVLRRRKSRRKEDQRG